MDRQPARALEKNLAQANNSKSQDFDPLRACVHCGLCLEECPTYRLSGDEANSPRGRLLLWRSESEGRNSPNELTDFYTDECVGCLACEPVCPANVPYRHLLEEQRRKQFHTGRSRIKPLVSLAAMAVTRPAALNALLAPARALRRLGLPLHRMAFPGKPAVLQSTARYAARLVAERQPTGPTVALLTGCLMESLFREINFATVEALVRHNIRVVVPEGQACCGAFHDHAGLPQAEALRETNRQAFAKLEVDAILANSAGCGLALSHTLEDGYPPVMDVLTFLARQELKSIPNRPEKVRLYVDQPCHLVHGQRARIPESVLDATGYPWEYAPFSTECCGSGGIYNLQKPENAEAILRRKAAFLDELPNDIQPILTTSNHVCMMQWRQARRFIQHPFQIQHLTQLLLP